jgi:hypothetical protein
MGRYSAAFSAVRVRVEGTPVTEVLFRGCCQVLSDQAAELDEIEPAAVA